MQFNNDYTLKYQVRTLGYFMGFKGYFVTFFHWLVKGFRLECVAL